ncbi:tRNA nucleotidyltransferase (CCA-adding enzyme) [Ruminococcus sp. YE71]|uniref:CCA tRNA nucleotidyltransferase n=1 Tax=unclassified Ruminococcus TaxID=2608920 RepID=UPI0008864496|nr:MULTISPECIES: HD domain-containing protein [unclassified Ruminococcus]SDA09672.1 tRNA nucleotidyltransferase (CCA-adding enzyme) [Ruminococcus sp. YE78]SFW11662.1 tRNA nucleotidyltransferase (CCA-adding enzyme) [Ruminococcus sp. YE71]
MEKIKIPPAAARALELLETAGYEAWCVGGCVRDALRGCEPHDWDVCTSASPDEMLKVFARFRTIPTGIKHGTLTVIIMGEQIEITTYRCDGEYADHRRPDSVIFVRDIRSDLERRDFTMNAICVDLRGELYDPFDGQADIKRGLIRCVGDPYKRFDEDALRILRAVRFAAKTGFLIDEPTRKAAVELRGLLDSVSAERIWSELRSLLTQPHAGDVLREHREIIAQILPEAKACFGFDQHNPHHCYDVWEHITHSVDFIEPDPLLRTVMLLHDIGKPLKYKLDENGVGHFKLHQLASADIAEDVLTRMKSDNYTKKRVCALIAEHDDRIPAEKRPVRRFISKYDYDFFGEYLKVRRADTLAQSMYLREEKLAELDRLGEIAAQLREEDSCLKVNQLAVNGKDLMALGFKGKAVGEELKRLLAAVIEEELPNEHDALLASSKEQPI